MAQYFQNVSQYTQGKLSLIFFVLVGGFIGGNMFGFVTQVLHSYSLVSLGSLILLEFISFVRYQKWRTTMIPMPQYLLWHHILNTAKRGFLIGIFVEAFKVGS
jgi:hypothetical protein